MNIIFTSILIMIIICLVILIQMIFIRNRKNSDKEIKDLLSKNISITTHKKAYYISVILLIIICISSYILFGYFILISKISNFDLRSSFSAILSFFLFCISYFFMVWIFKHSRYLKNDYCLIYKKNGKEFLILNISYKKMLVVSSMSCKIINNNLLKIKSAPVIYIKDIKDLNSCKIRYINNKIH